jgi:hypothetical protein
MVKVIIYTACALLGASPYLILRWRSWLPNWFAADFINHTSLSTEELRQQFEEAKRDIAGQVISLDLRGEHTINPDPAALKVKPRGICVRGVDDHGEGKFKDSGQFVYSCVSQPGGMFPLVLVASSLLRDNATGTVGYEFENIILAKLGYNVSAR